MIDLFVLVIVCTVVTNLISFTFFMQVRKLFLLKSKEDSETLRILSSCHLATQAEVSGVKEDVLKVDGKVDDVKKEISDLNAKRDKVRPTFKKGV